MGGGGGGLREGSLGNKGSKGSSYQEPFDSEGRLLCEVTGSIENRFLEERVLERMDPPSSHPQTLMENQDCCGSSCTTSAPALQGSR